LEVSSRRGPHTPHRHQKDQQRLTDATLAHGGGVFAEAVSVNRADVPHRAPNTPSIGAILGAAQWDGRNGRGRARLAGVDHQDAHQGRGYGIVALTFGPHNKGGC